MSSRLPIGPEQSEFQNALYLAHCANAAYERSNISDYVHYPQIAFDQVESFEGPHDTQGFVGATSQAIVLAFRGTEPDRWTDWCTDLNSLQRLWNSCQVHSGFSQAHDGVARQYLEIIRRLRTTQQAIYVTGHSLGGALAILAGKVLATGGEEGEDFKPQLVISFGAPKVGDTRFVSTYGVTLLRFVHNEDIIPHVPPMGHYIDGGSLLYFKADGSISYNVNDIATTWNRLKNAVSAIVTAKGRISDLVPNWIQDHVMERYIERLTAMLEKENAQPAS